MGGATFARVASLFVVAHPITLRSVQSGGFDFLAGCFALLVLKRLLDHGRAPSPVKLAMLWMNLGMFTEIRYEHRLPREQRPQRRGHLSPHGRDRQADLQRGWDHPQGHAIERALLLSSDFHQADRLQSGRGAAEMFPCPAHGPLGVSTLFGASLMAEPPSSSPATFLQ